MRLAGGEVVRELRSLPVGRSYKVGLSPVGFEGRFVRLDNDRDGFQSAVFESAAGQVRRVPLERIATLDTGGV